MRAAARREGARSAFEGVGARIAGSAGARALGPSASGHSKMERAFPLHTCALFSLLDLLHSDFVFDRQAILPLAVLFHIRALAAWDASAGLQSAQR